MAVSGIRDISTTDVVLVSGDGQELPAHSGNLRSQAEYFTDSDISESVIQLPESQAVLDALLDFMYPYVQTPLPTLDNNLVVQLYHAAVKYGARRVQELLHPRLRELLNDNIAPEIYTSAFIGGDEQMAKIAARYMLNMNVDDVTTFPNLSLLPRLRLVDLQLRRAHHVIDLLVKLSSLKASESSSRCVALTRDTFVNQLTSRLDLFINQQTTIDDFITASKETNGCPECKAFISIMRDTLEESLKQMPDTIHDFYRV